MHHITLAWLENGERVTRTLEVGDETIEPGVFRIGRDPEQCDVVLPSATERDRTVSRCHVEISFDADRFGFYLTNLKANNPPYIKGEPVTDSIKLTQGCTVELGEVELVVQDIVAVPETIIIQRPRQAPPQQQVTILRDRSDFHAAKPPAASGTDRSADAGLANTTDDSTIDPDAAMFLDDSAEVGESSELDPTIDPIPPQPQATPVVVHAASQSVPPEPTVPPASTPVQPKAASAPQPSTPPAPPAGSVFDRVKDQLFSCPKGHKYTLAEAKELGWICKYDGYLITSTFVAK
ncbi:MAG: FHA domain-containing protein [Synechococcus sp.]